ncbi:glycosyltransferase family 1 protein [Pseudolysinimonas kribbensis]|uniref:Glycosyl transferase n=1 Tax=Pseudolysinimonas kribbensis TaxID=433641 RepID=A0ABQ6K3Y2_9MICO|nr:glycosyltransferase family 1 protein [Pseudolysinimonas kribbensis]GMA94278.1 glycosyl transferase [Pseudolysinimonas kribbensis]
MIPLRVIVDEIVNGTAGVARYAEELTRAVVATRPPGTEVTGIVASSPEADRLLAERLPGLPLRKSALARRELAAAWQRGITVLPGTGMVHATSLLAPLRRHDRAADPASQIAVTIHDAIAWTQPDLLPARTVSWTRAMARRAERYADAVVVPTHAVAADLDEELGLGDRLRVIGGAPSTTLSRPVDASARRGALGLPARYVLAVTGWEPRTGLAALLTAMSRIRDRDLVVVGAAAAHDEVLAAATEAGAVERVHVLDRLGDDDLGAVLDGAEVFVQPSLAEGFSLAMIDAFAFGLPVVLSDAPALVEVAADAGLVVERGDAGRFPARLADALRGVLDDDALRERLAVAAADRARLFSWRDAGEKVWQLHADL